MDFRQWYEVLIGRVAKLVILPDLCSFFSAKKEIDFCLRNANCILHVFCEVKIF